jgi:hypothetical protein
MWADPAVTRFIGGVPSTKQQTWSRLLAYVGHWPIMGFGYWAIEERTTGEFAGEIGFADFKRDTIPAMKDVPELGFARTKRRITSYRREVSVSELRAGRARERTSTLLRTGAMIGHGRR